MEKAPPKSCDLGGAGELSEEVGSARLSVQPL